MFKIRTGRIYCTVYKDIVYCTYVISYINIDFFKINGRVHTLAAHKPTVNRS